MKADCSDRVQAIVEQLRLLHRSDQGYEIFGAYRHRYGVNPVLATQAIQDLMPTPEFELPDEYLEFIQCIGNGGAGPSYGILSPQNSLKQSGWRKLLLNFQYTAAWQPLFGSRTWIELEKRKELTEYMNTPIHETQRAEYDTWRDRYESGNHLNGSLTISHEGCGHETLLIVSGPERGYIWRDSRILDAGISPLNGPGHRLTFFDWYEQWLDDSIQELKGDS